MASIDTLISVAEECVGMNLKECVKHFDTSDPGVDWCAWFVRQCGAKADMNFGSSNTASKLWGLNGNFSFVGSNFPKEVDLAFIDPKGNDNITHIGIISEITDDQIITVEGNMSGDTIYDSIVKNGKYDLKGYSSAFGHIVWYGSNS